MYDIIFILILLVIFVFIDIYINKKIDNQDKLIEEQRLRERTLYDIEK